ncbi:MAG TPA: LamG domain-containing protein, partial [Candidatus Paceibacterota bacterium]|nr:LamG domain-containing protein [Candidatus Paceibacterota bacterium]
GASYPVPEGDLGGGQWIHLAGTYDGGSWRLFRNGIEVTNAADGVGALPATYGDWAIGATGMGWTNGFAGAVDEVAIYNTALTPAMIATHYYVAQSGAVSLSITRSGGSVTIQWPVGTLQQADTLTGVWTNVSGAVPPSYTATTGTQKFYRVKL